MKNLIKEIKKLKNKKIAILCHEFPDGDCIGSALALAFLLKKIGNDVIVVSKDKIPDCYNFLQKTIKIIKLSKVDSKIANLIEVIIFVDSVSELRVGYSVKNIFKNIKKSINIDHHISNDKFCDFNYIEKVGATAEIIASIFLNLFKNIEKEPATSLYLGIMMDTGNLIYEMTNYKTIKIVSELCKMGADINMFRKKIYEEKSINSMNGLKLILNNLKYGLNKKIAYTYLDFYNIQKLKLSLEDFTGYINYPNKIKNVEMALFFKEIDKKNIKVSIRTKSSFNANEIAKIFGGGGHEKAAGFKKNGELKKVIKEVINKIKENIKNEWNNNY